MIRHKYSHNHKRNKQQLIVVLAIVALLAIIMGATCYRIFVKSSSAPTTSPSKVAQLPAIPKALAFKGKYLAVGDVFWGRRMEKWSNASELKTAYPFKDLSTFDRAKYNDWIGDMECPVTPHAKTDAEQESLLSFNCSPDFLDEASKWFSLMTVANNHTDNVNGESGLSETITNLYAHNMQVFGHYDNSKTEDVCEVVSLRGSANYDDSSTKPALLPVAMCGYHGVFKIPLESELQQIRNYASVLPTFVFVHMGVEYQPVHDQLRQSVYRSMIDLGAVAVFGDHPHWVQDTEAYRGRLIVYSLGNFMFDQQGSMDLTTGIGIDFELTYDAIDNPQLDKLLNLGPGCKQYKDVCLAKITELNTTYGFGIKYALVVSSNAEHTPTLASPNIRDYALKRTLWETTLPGLETKLSKVKLLDE